MFNWLNISCLLCTFLVLQAKVLRYQPEQVHLSFGENVNEIVITWSTMDDVGENGAIVEYGIDVLNLNAQGKSEKFVDGGFEKRAQYIHRVVLKDLKPETKYLYHCGSELGWSAEFWFVVPRTDSDYSPHIAIYGDMGNKNAQSLPRLQEEAQRHMYDAIIHAGDFAYDMDTDNGRVGDQFMRQIEPIAAYVPYMTCVGNHEQRYNFSHYRARFSMPLREETENMMYSFDLGPVHFIAFSTEVYYFLNYGKELVKYQYDWLERDLIEATKPENRALRPWIVTYGHRPMYCSNANILQDCTWRSDVVRVGLASNKKVGLESLFYRYGVDVEIWAHEHSYERFWPLYDYKVKNGSTEHPYTNPKAPIHIVTGAAGNKEGRAPFKIKVPAWSAFHSNDYGYTRLKAYNVTHLHFEQVSDDKDGAVIDSFYVIKDKHGAYDDLDEI